MSGGGDAPSGLASAGARLIEVAAEAGLARAGAAYLLSAFAAERQGATAAQWAEALSRPALPFVLQLLGSLARTHAGTQQLLLAPEVMGTIHALEQHSSSASKAIGTWAEALLEAMRDAGLAATVDRLRQSTQASKRKAALDQRQRILSSMGMSAAAGDGKGPGSKRVVVSAAATAALIGDLQEEVGHVCVVCGEGEAYRPGETLGVYVFTKRVPLPSLCEPCGGAASAAHASPVSRGSPFLPYGSALGSLGLGGAVAPSEACHTTVSHFNTIHVRCHREAATAERSLKQPKQEWEGATLRNSRTRANALLPFWGATVGEEAYGACVEQFWAQAQSTGRADAPRPKLLAHNLRLLLLRFACEEQFSHDARGGGRESNIRLLPYFVQMATYLLDAKGEAQRRSHRRSLAAFVEAEGGAGGAGGEAAAAAGGGAAESVLFFLILSLLLHSPDEWAAAKPAFLRRLLRDGAAAVARERLVLAAPPPPPSSPGSGPSRDPRSPLSAPLSGPEAGAGSSRSPHRRASPLVGALLTAEPPALAPLPASAAASSSGAASSSAAAGGAAGADDGGGGDGAPDAGDAFAPLRPALIFFGLVDKLQSILKDPRPYQPAEAGAAPGAWVARLAQRLRQHDQAVLSELASLLADYEAELLTMADLDEAFDVLGLTALALEAGSSVSEFVARAKSAG